MRELFYLSDAKLRQFVPERRRTRMGQRLSAIRLTTPAGGVELEATGDADPERQRQQHLSAVIRYIEERAFWFQDPDAGAGNWVYFEAPLLAFIVRGSRAQRGTVLFVDPPHQYVRAYDQPEGIRLILHGSDEHLLTPGRSATPVLWELSAMDGSNYNTQIPSFEIAQPPVAEDIGDEEEPPYLSYTDAADVQLHNLVKSPFNWISPRDAVWMRGYARVSTVRNIAQGNQRYPLIVATPLYVEYAHDLPN